MSFDKLDHQFRMDYEKGSLSEQDIKKNPFLQFENWFSDIIKLNQDQPNAMIISTTSKAGQPSSRVVLLKEFSKKGFVFFTDYRSQKGQELIENPKASLLFYNQTLERQIRVEGIVKKIAYDESNSYFQSRPLKSQYSAMVSHQSSEIPSRQFLEDKYKEIEKKYKLEKPACPNFWGGFVLEPNYFEFWQGRPSRLHDRLSYNKTKSGWTINRLSP